MKKPLLTALLASATFLTYAQVAPPLQWAHSFGNSYWDGAAGITADTEGNVYVGGSFGMTVDFDPTDGVTQLNGGNLAALVSKYNNDGGLVWAKAFTTNSYSSQVNAIARDAQGNVITTGTFGGTCDFNPSTGVFNISGMTIPYSATDIFISKLDANGDFVWAKAIQSVPTIEKGVSSVATDASGNIYIAGVFEETIDFDPSAAVHNLTAQGIYDYYIAKFDTNGNFLWAKSAGGANSSTAIRDIAVYGNAVYLGGDFTKTVDFDPGAGVLNLTAHGTFSSDIFLARFTADGTFEWAKNIGSSNESKLYSLTTDTAGNLLASGYINGLTDVDPGDGVHNFGAAGTGMFVLKLDSNAGFSWVRGMATGTSSMGFNAVADADGNVYASGAFYNSASFFEQAGGNMVSYGEKDLYLAKLSADGVPLWQKQMGGVGEEDMILAAPSLNGSVYIAGNFKQALHFVPGTAENDLAAVDLNDLFIARFAFPDAAGTVANTKERLLAYPNPTTGTLFIDAPDALLGAKAAVYTLLGQRVAQFELTSKTTRHSFAKGFYILQVDNGREIQSIKFVVE